MTGTTTVSKPGLGKTGIFPLGDGRWALFINGLVRHVAYSEKQCWDRAHALGMSVPPQ